jgi:hypothetical protein
VSERAARPAASHVAADRDLLVELCVIAAEFEGLFRRFGLVEAADAAFDLFEALEYELLLPYASDEGDSLPLSLSPS